MAKSSSSPFFAAASEQSIPHTDECLQQLRQCNKVLSPTDRQRLHELLAATADVLASDSHRRLSEAKSAAKSERRAKRQRAAAAAKNDAGARLGVLRHLKGDTAAKCLSHLRADDFRNLASIKCCRDEGSERVLRAGVKLACEAIAPYPDPPQLLLGTRGYEPLAVLEDSQDRAGAFLTPRMLEDENWHRFTRSSSSQGYGHYTLSLDQYCASNSGACNPRPRCERYATVAAAVIEIVRRVPNEFSNRTRRNWFAEWIASFVADDALRVDSDTSPSRLEQLDGAGFATMIRDAILSPEATQATQDRLSEGFEAALRTADKSTLRATFASEAARLKRWRDAGLAVLKYRLSTIRGADGILDVGMTAPTGDATDDSDSGDASDDDKRITSIFPTLTVLSIFSRHGKVWISMKSGVSFSMRTARQVFSRIRSDLLPGSRMTTQCFILVPRWF